MKLSTWGVFLILLFGFSSAHAQMVYDVFIIDDGEQRLGTLELPTGVQRQTPGGEFKNCELPDESDTGFDPCQLILFRPDPVFFSGINDSDVDLTEPFTSNHPVFWFLNTETGALDFILSGFVYDFGSDITTGDPDFRYVELYFDNRFEPSPFDVCATARTEVLGFQACFEGEEDRLIDNVEFRLRAAPAKPIPSLTILAQLALVLLIVGLGVAGIRKRSYKST